MMLAKSRPGSEATRGTIGKESLNKIMLETKGAVGTERRMTSFTPAAQEGEHQAVDFRVNIVVAIKELKPAIPRAHCKG